MMSRWQMSVYANLPCTSECLSNAVVWQSRYEHLCESANYDDAPAAGERIVL